MRSDESYENPLFLEVEFCYQPVRIAFYVKNNPAVLKDTGICISILDIVGSLPV
jgi:hypothetical protein